MADQFPGPAAEIRSLVTSVAILNPSSGGCLRYTLANGRKVDYWPSTGTFMEVGTGHGFRRCPDRLPSFVRLVAAQPGKFDRATGEARNMSDKALASAARRAYPLLPGLHPKGLAERSLVHELAHRVSNPDEWPELLLTDVYHPEEDFIYD